MMQTTVICRVLGHLAVLLGCLVFNSRAQIVRQPNSTLRLPQVPGAPGYRLVDALQLQFTNPVALASPRSDTNRLFIAELPGRVVVVTNLMAPTRTVFLDLTSSTVLGGEQGLLSLAFHPDYLRNGRFFVHRVAWGKAGRELRLSEFRASAADPAAADTSETVILSQRVSGFAHFGGDLHFGRDGYLYGSVGDGGSAEANSQRMDGAIFSGIFRIDVDGRTDSAPPNPLPDAVQNYRVPSDNPFLGATEFLGKPVEASRVRTEFWAVGLRNPFRFSFDAATGDLWVGDVGHQSFESIFLSGRGVNHGWGFLEGRHPGPMSATAPAGFQTDPAFSYQPPRYSYNHAQGNSVIGGLVYRGRALSQLYGASLFADHYRGHLYALFRQPDGLTNAVALTWKPLITGFGMDPRDGEVLVTELAEGRVWHLTYNSQFTGSPLPATLAETGAFADPATLTPAPGIVPYSVSLPFWSDDATKQRWFSVPDTNQFLKFSPHDTWSAPPGTVWIKHFELELTNGVAESRRRLETRFLVRNTAGVYGITYRWDSPTNASLVAEQGAEELLPRQVPGRSFTQRWRYPARAECLVCHTPQAGFVLGFNTAQLNCDQSYGAMPTNQLSALTTGGYFDGPTTSPHTSPRLAHPTNELASLEWRARSYLAANCSPCHRPGGTGLGFWDARLETPTALAGLLDGVLLDPHDDAVNRVIAPGAPVHSVLLQKLATRGPGQMPPLASSLVDESGVELLRRWIESLPDETPGEAAVSLVPAWHEGRLRLHVSQPANRSVRLEYAERLELSAWRPMELPEAAPFFPASPRTLVLEPATTESSGFYRALTQAP